MGSDRSDPYPDMARIIPRTAGILADVPIMKVGNAEAVGVQFAVRVEKLSQDAMKQEGEAAVALIEDAGAAARPVGPNGEGTLVNKFA